MTEQIHFGATLPHPLIAVLKAKVPSPQTLRKIVVEGHRFTPKEALALGLVDHIVEGNTEAVVTAAQALGDKLGPIAKTGAWGVNKVRHSLCLIRPPTCSLMSSLWWHHAASTLQGRDWGLDK